MRDAIHSLFSPSVVRHVVELRRQKRLGQKVTDRRNCLEAVKHLRDIDGLVELGRGGGWDCGGAPDHAAYMAERGDSALRSLTREFHHTVAVEHRRDNHPPVAIQVQWRRGGCYRGGRVRQGG